MVGGAVGGDDDDDVSLLLWEIPNLEAEDPLRPLTNFSMFLISLESLFSVLFSLTSSDAWVVLLAFEDSSLLFLLFSSGLFLDKFSDAVTSDLVDALASSRPANFLTD